MNYIRFFLNNKRMLSFGFLLTFFSSFGQTFVVSLYVPSIIKEFNFSNFVFGMIYSGATILSALTLIFVGKFIDHCNLRNYTLSAVFLLIASCFALAFSLNPIFVFFGFWGLRLAGQGLFSHISNTSISKFFHETSGKALSLSVLGYSAGEAFLPISIGFLIGYLGWRVSMVFSAALVGLILIPFVWVALRHKESQIDLNPEQTKKILSFSRRQLLKDKRFYIIALSSSVLFFSVTGLFFYQLILAEEKGWPVELITMSFFGFALGRTVFSLVSGKLIDRFSALKIFPIYLIPFAVGIVLLSVFSYSFVAPAYLILTGISIGLSGPLKTALLAEVYGTLNLGSIRAALASIAVFSSALSPALFGFLLDSGFTFTFISAGLACIVLAVIFISRYLPALQSKPRRF